jgi:hypothetical protein
MQKSTNPSRGPDERTGSLAGPISEVGSAGVARLADGFDLSCFLIVFYVAHRFAC